MRNEPTERAADHIDEIRKAYLAHADVPCPRCGYNLRSVTDRACPECGRRIELGLRGGTAPKGVWWFAVVASTTLLLGEGLDGVTGVLRCVNWYGWDVPPSHEAWTNWMMSLGQVAFSLAGGLCLVLLLRPPRIAGPRVIRTMVVLAVVYGLGWVASAAYWTVRWWTG